MPEYGIKRLAARDAVFLAVTATVRASEEMLDAGVSGRQWLLAEEAESSLQEHESVELLHCDGRLTINLPALEGC